MIDDATRCPVCHFVMALLENGSYVCINKECVESHPVEHEIKRLEEKYDL